MRKITVVLIAILFIFPTVALSAPEEAVQSMRARLEAWDVEEAWSELKGLLVNEPKDSELLEVGSLIAFYRGEYEEALKMMRSAIEQKGNDQRKGFALFIEQTIGVVNSFKRYETPHFIITLDEKQDGILVNYLIETMEKTHQIMAEKYGFQPKEKIRIEVFPDTKAFYFASSLSARDIEVTGAVGLAKFNKLMVLSPRALVYGYRWLDAISHEYMHYLIVKLTEDKAPIWFHEGLSKYEETSWRNGSSYLTNLYKTLLARAIDEEKLIGFEKMEPSLVKLEKPEDVQLAYAQAASAIEFILTKAGQDGLREVMRKMSTSSKKGASDSIQEVMGLDFSEFEKSWKEFLLSKGFKEVTGVNVRRYKIKEGKGDEDRLDMEEIKSQLARNKAHLGDLLEERGRREAAIIEYRRALAETNDSVPIMNRLSSALIELGRNEEALEILIRAKDISPDHPTIYTALGKIYLNIKSIGDAKDAFETSIQINPFNPDVHRGLATIYGVLGDHAAGLKEREIAKRLEQ